MKSDVPGLGTSPPNGPLTMAGVAAGQAVHSSSHGCSPWEEPAKSPGNHSPQAPPAGRRSWPDSASRRVCFLRPLPQQGGWTRLEAVPSGLPSFVRAAGALAAASGTRTLWDSRLSGEHGTSRTWPLTPPGPCCVVTREHRRLSSDWGDCGPGKSTGAGGRFLLQGWNPRLLLPGTPTAAPPGQPLCSQGAPKTPPTTPVLMGASRAGAQGHVQSRASALLLRGSRAAERPRSSGSPGRTRPQRRGVCGGDTAPSRRRSSPSETEKLITLLDGKALRGESQSSQSNV